jgi:hypothetical protein
MWTNSGSCTAFRDRDLGLTSYRTSMLVLTEGKGLPNQGKKMLQNPLQAL